MVQNVESETSMHESTLSANLAAFYYSMPVYLLANLAAFYYLDRSLNESPVINKIGVRRINYVTRAMRLSFSCAVVGLPCLRIVYYRIGLRIL
jgi:hypothetical protein